MVTEMVRCGSWNGSLKNILVEIRFSTKSTMFFHGEGDARCFFLEWWFLGNAS